MNERYKSVRYKNPDLYSLICGEIVAYPEKI